MDDESRRRVLSMSLVAWRYWESGKDLRVSPMYLMYVSRRLDDSEVSFSTIRRSRSLDTMMEFRIAINMSSSSSSSPRPRFFPLAAEADAEPEVEVAPARAARWVASASAVRPSTSSPRSGRMCSSAPMLWSRDKSPSPGAGAVAVAALSFN